MVVQQIALAFAYAKTYAGIACGLAYLRCLGSSLILFLRVAFSKSRLIPLAQFSRSRYRRRQEKRRKFTNEPTPIICGFKLDS
jgi:hypothetical protein